MYITQANILFLQRDREAGGSRGGNNNRAPRNDFAFLAFLPWPATAKQPSRRDRTPMGGHPGHLRTHASPPPPAHSVGVSGQHGPPSHSHQVPRWKQTSRLSVSPFFLMVLAPLLSPIPQFVLPGHVLGVPVPARPPRSSPTAEHVDTSPCWGFGVPAVG